MKKTLLLITLLPVFFGACKKAVDPADPLYRTWRWTQTEYKDGRIVNHPGAEHTIVTFRPNGMILYGANGRYAACCFPHQFRRETDKLDFTNVKSVPIPPVDNAETCHLVDCQLQGSFWRILSLDATQLVLETPFGEYLYQPYP